MTTDPTPASDTPIDRTSRPPVLDPSPGVRVTKELRELATDLGGMVLAAFFVHYHSLNVLYALAFVCVLVVPASVLTRYARIILARGSSAPAAAALLAASASLAYVKTGVVVGGAVLTLASCAGVL